MILKIVRIEPRVVTCQIDETGSLIDIARRWLTDDIQLDDTIEVDFSNR